MGPFLLIASWAWENVDSSVGEKETPMIPPQMLGQLSSKPGFIAALDQSGGSTPGALKLYGVPETQFDDDDEMFDLVHQMRSAS